MRRYATNAENLWAHVDKSGDCWLWNGAVTTAGYAQITDRETGRAVYTHRVSWEVAHGEPVPAGMYVCHTCDVRRCVNPDHLFIGTNRDNQLDAKAKGRLAIGDRHSQAKLTAAQVSTIKAAIAAGANKTHLAARHRVSRCAIQAIASGRNWRDVS